MVALTSAASAEASHSASITTPTTTMPASIRVRAMNNGAVSGHPYVVSRDGILLPWGRIHQKYKQNIGKSTTSVDEATGNNNGEGSDADDVDPMDAGTLLQLLPRGAYTPCRKVRGGTYVYQFDYHIRRLALSTRSILEHIKEENNIGDEDERRVSSKSLSKLIHLQQEMDEAWKREAALICIRSTLDIFRSQYQIPNMRSDSADGNGPDFRITLLAT